MTGVAVQPAGLGAGGGGAGRRGAGGGVGGVGGAGGGHRLQLHAGDPHVSSTPSPLEGYPNVREDFAITEEAPTRQGLLLIERAN